MKRYNINYYNGAKIMIDLVFIPISIIYLPAVWVIISLIWLKHSDSVAIPTLICAVLAAAGLGITLYFGLANHFYYDEKNEEIILKLIHQEPKRIPIRDIALVSRKVNTNRNKGPVTFHGRSDAYERKTYGVSDAEGRDFFYIKEDRVILELFESLGVKIIYKE